MTNNRLTLALAQIDLILGNPARNLQTVRSQIAAARARGADLVLLPELWSTAYDLEHAAAHASSRDAGMFVEITRAAREYEIAVAGSLLEVEGTRFYNTATYVDAHGQCLGAYRKLHLVPMLEEDRYLTGGNDEPVFGTDYCPCALAVCYDLRFPELWRDYALAGARVVLLAAEWPLSRIGHWRALLPARAIENQFFIAATNRVGTTKGVAFGGNSMIVDPWGEVLVEGDQQPDLLVAEIDLSRVDEVRKQVPVLKDRRPDVYGQG